MLDFILDNKWIFLIIAEVIFWLSILTFLVLRYWFRLNRLSIVFFVLFIINDLWIATMGFFDYLRTGEFSIYQIIILVIIVYALTYGKRDFAKLDAFIQRKVASWKGEPVPNKDAPKELNGKGHAAKERQGFYGHLGVYAAVHVVFFIVYGLSETVSLDNINHVLGKWFSEEVPNFPFANTGINNFSRIWTIILIIDAVISFSYTIWPKKRNQ
jgi:hypothetical protein